MPCFSRKGCAISRGTRAIDKFAPTHGLLRIRHSLPTEKIHLLSLYNYNCAIMTAHFVRGFNSLFAVQIFATLLMEMQVMREAFAYSYFIVICCRICTEKLTLVGGMARRKTTNGEALILHLLTSVFATMKINILDVFSVDDESNLFAWARDFRSELR